MKIVHYSDTVTFYSLKFLTFVRTYCIRKLVIWDSELTEIKHQWNWVCFFKFKNDFDTFIDEKVVALILFVSFIYSVSNGSTAFGTYVFQNGCFLL